MQPEYDPKTAFGGGVSLSPSTLLSGSTPVTGDWIDCGELQGIVWADCQNGVVVSSGTTSGTSDPDEPSAYSATYKLREADTAGGSGAQDIPIQDSALVLDADKESGILRGRRTKRYVAVHVTPAFTGGDEPVLNVSAIVHGLRIHA